MSDIKSITEVTALATDEYSSASFRVIKDLQAKVSKLQAENESLLQILEQNTPALIQTSDLSIHGVPKEQIICEAQIALLLGRATSGTQMTMEEVKKFQILTEVLQKYKTIKPTEEEITVKQMTDEQLIAQALKPEVI